MTDIEVVREDQSLTLFSVVVGLLGIGGSVFWMAVTLVGFSNPGGLTIGVTVAMVGVGLVLAVTAAAAAIAIAFGPMKGLRWIAWLGIASVPVALLATVLLVRAGLPLEFRLTRSEDALIKHEQDLKSGTLSPETRRKVGWFTVLETKLRGDCVVFVTYERIFTKDGLAHCPPGVEPPLSSSSGDFKRIRAGWWEAIDIGGY